MNLQSPRECQQGARFEFGRNWTRFLAEIDESRIEQAQHSLAEMLEVQELKHQRFLDVGSGSGLFSLAARKLGATVHSFDYDAQSVACTQELRRRYCPDDPGWVIEQGSVLDVEYLQSLGKWDVVYSWGVLHHTGDMKQALENVSRLVDGTGRLYIAIYNDQGRTSGRWLAVKKLYNRLPRGLRWLVLCPAMLRLWGPTMLRDLLRGRPFHTWRNYSKGSRRGMSAWRDVVDWVGGLPFEVAKPDDIFRYFRGRNFDLTELKTCAGGLGCNEFVFRRLDDKPSGLADEQPSSTL